MNVQVPDPLRDAAGFHAWSLMYLERTLCAEDERAFEKLLASSNDAALAFARAAQLDTDLHECLEGAPAIARIPASPAGAEILDPRNVADMRFVSDQIRVSAESQARDRNVSQRVMAVRRSRRYWLPGLAAAGLAAAGLAAAVAAYAIHSYASGTKPEPGPSHTQMAANTKNRIDTTRKETVAEKPAYVNANDKAVVAERLPEPIGVPKKRDNVGEIVETTPPSIDDVRVVDAPKKDVDPVPARTHELPLVPNKVTPPPAEEPAAAIDEADCKRLADNAAWRGIGSLALRRENEKVEIDQKYDGKDPYKIGATLYGGMVYRKPIDPERGVVTFKLAVESAALSSAEHDFQFVLNNSRLTDRNNVYLSVKDQISAVKDRLNLNARQHVFELVVRKYNVFELRIDGIKTHTIALELNRPEWEKIYLGFRTSSRGNDAQPVVVGDVSLRYLEK